MLKDKDLVTGAELAALSKKAREKAGKTRQQAADEMAVKWASIFQAEENPRYSLFKLRSRMIQRYAGLVVEGPLYRLKKIRE